MGHKGPVNKGIGGSGCKAPNPYAISQSEWWYRSGTCSTHGKEQKCVQDFDGKTWRTDGPF
jgi:hypothetical protein